MITSDTRSPKSTADIRVHIKKSSLILKNHTFDGTDPVRVFNFLARFVSDADLLSMSEAQYFITLPTFLAEPEETQLRTNFSGASRHVGHGC